MKKIIILVIISISLLGCGSMDKKASELDSVISENNYIVLDVRTKEEYDSGHVVNSLNIPVEEIDENINIDKNKTILVYCRSGVRSKKAKDTLVSLGYKVYDMGAFSNVPLDKE